MLIGKRCLATAHDTICVSDLVLLPTSPYSLLLLQLLLPAQIEDEQSEQDDKENHTADGCDRRPGPVNKHSRVTHQVRGENKETGEGTCPYNHYRISKN